MIIGAHSIIFSKDPDSDRSFFRDVLKMPNIDVGSGWLIFGLPPSEIAVHPAKKNNVHEFFLLCDDVKSFIGEMKKRKIVCSPIKKENWGLLTQVTLPGGGKLGVYQPLHARPSTQIVTKAGNSTKHAVQKDKKTAQRKAKS